MILYTPAGDTDPIRNCYDGPILHIIRKYRPRLARIFLSGDMSAKERTDKRYSRAIRHLEEHLRKADPGYSCAIEFIYTDIREVNLMDRLLLLAEEFSGLREKYPEEEILLNISSGTPQMKSIMSFLATDFENVRAVQVQSPNKASNRRTPAAQDGEDIDAIIENNLDDEPDYEDRCVEPALRLLRRYGIRYQLVSLIQSYEYSAALLIYSRNKSMFADETGRLLEHAALRSRLQYKEAFKLNVRPPLKDDRLTALNEFFMVMQLRQKKGDLVEFIMKLTPYLYELLLYHLEHSSAVRPCGFCEDGKRPYRISLAKLRAALPQAAQALSARFGGGFRDGTELSFSNMLLISPYCSDISESTVRQLEALRQVEARHRNFVAHNIGNLTEERLAGEEPHLNSSKILAALYSVTKALLGEKNIYVTTLYDRLNESIIRSMDKFRL